GHYRPHPGPDTTLGKVRISLKPFRVRLSDFSVYLKTGQPWRLSQSARFYWLLVDIHDIRGQLAALKALRGRYTMQFRHYGANATQGTSNVD
ncbi:hypothetical protein, partial [Rhizobium leguminosarum]|uniref:hypothetical protein n=1 Tax=Rhizobium leguminosarum TaxID=384 RepID=UPI00197EB1BC